MRYAADFVVMMKGRDVALEAFIEERLEARMGLKLNRDKTRVVELREEGASLEFLGYLFRWDRDRLRPERGSIWNSESVEEVDRAGEGTAAGDDECVAIACAVGVRGCEKTSNSSAVARGCDMSHPYSADNTQVICRGVACYARFSS